MTDENKQLIIGLMENEPICVVSTINLLGFSESAAVAFTSFDDLSVAFQTPNTTRKYTNLKQNSNVSIVIGWDPVKMQTIQLEGAAIEVENPDQVNNIRTAQLKKNSSSEKYAYLEENKYFLVTPKWIRYSDLHTSPPIVLEMDSSDWA